MISLWGFGAVGSKAIGDDKSCSAKDLENNGIRLAITSKPNEVLEILNGDPTNPARAACIRRGETAMVVCADSFFLVFYSLLTLALFLFVRALSSGKPCLQGVLLNGGVFLALTMAIGDFVENRYLTELIQLAGQSLPPPERIAEKLPNLRVAAYIKMGALVLSAALLAALWPSRSRWLWVLKLLGFAAAAVLTYGMMSGEWKVISCGMYVFAAFWLAALIHATAVAVGPEPSSFSQAVQAQGGPKS